MKTLASLSFSLAAALAFTGCAADRNGNDDDDVIEEPDPQQPQEPERKLDLVGSYRVVSTFDLATNMPGSSGDFVRGLIEATDDQDDPMSWVVDQMLAQMEPSTFKDILVGAKPFVIDWLNDEVTSLAPDLVGTLVELGQRMNDLTKDLGINEKFDVAYVDQQFLGRITADGVRFKMGTTTTDVLFADADVDNVTAEGVYFRLQNETHANIAEHKLPLPYGAIVRLGLDHAVIPAIDPTATSLADLLDNVVDCQGVGQQVANALGFGSPGLYAGACHAGLEAAADLVYDQIVASDARLVLQLTGTARVSDINNDYKVDKFSAGAWTGSMTYETDTTTMAQPAQFTGERF